MTAHHNENDKMRSLRILGCRCLLSLLLLQNPICIIPVVNNKRTMKLICYLYATEAAVDIAKQFDLLEREHS